MQIWVIHAIISMFFAGFTSVIAKKGLTGISSDIGVTIRTCFVFLFTTMFACAFVPHKDWAEVKGANYLWLAGSALTTTLSWIFYYKAIKIGEVSIVALIDKGSVVVAILLAFVLLHESITLPKMAGSALILAGLVIVARG